MFQVNQYIQHIQHIQLWEQQVGECLEHSPWGSGLDAATWLLLWRPLVLSHSSSAIHPVDQVQQAAADVRPRGSGELVRFPNQMPPRALAIAAPMPLCVAVSRRVGFSSQKKITTNGFSSRVGFSSRCFSPCHLVRLFYV
jgi:hypothetical protein